MVWANYLNYSKEIFSVEPKELISKVEKRFHELIQEHKSQLLGQPFEYVIRRGKVYKEICAVAEELDAFLLVIGTHGSSGFEEFWIGSDANRIVSSTQRPIITIQLGVDVGRHLERIVMPLDRSKETCQKVPMTALLAGYFNSEVHILGLSTSSLDDVKRRVRNSVAQAEGYFKEKNLRYTVHNLETDTIAEATLKYAKGINANLISIMAEKESETSNVLLAHSASRIVNHSPIPVLCIPQDTDFVYDS